MMEQPTSATPDYTMGFSQEMLESLMRHNAEAHAAHLLPHVRPGPARPRLRLRARHRLRGPGQGRRPRHSPRR